MRIIESLAWSQIFLDLWPSLNLSCIREKHADDCTLLSCLLDREEGLAGNPSVGLGLLVGLAFTLTNDNVESIVAQVACLTRTLDTITDDGDCFILQYFTCFLQ